MHEIIVLEQESNKLSLFFVCCPIIHCALQKALGWMASSHCGNGTEQADCGNHVLSMLDLVAFGKNRWWEWLTRMWGSFGRPNKKGQTKKFYVFLQLWRNLFEEPNGPKPQFFPFFLVLLMNDFVRPKPRTLRWHFLETWQRTSFSSLVRFCMAHHLRPLDRICHRRRSSSEHAKNRFFQMEFDWTHKERFHSLLVHAYLYCFWDESRQP